MKKRNTKENEIYIPKEIENEKIYNYFTQILKPGVEIIHTPEHVYYKKDFINKK